LLFACVAAAALLGTACGRLSIVGSQPQPGGAQSLMEQLPGMGQTTDQSMGDTWSNIHAFQVFDGGIPTSQAKADAYRYGFVWGTSKPAAWKSGNSKIVTSWYAPFDGDFTTWHNLSWWQRNHPSWVLYKCNKQTPAGMDGLKNVPLDISNPAVVRWQMQTYAPVMEAGGYDALAEDLVGLNNANGGCGVFINGVWHQRFTGQIIDDVWSQAVLAWHRYAYAYLHSLSRPLQIAVNHVPENRSFGDPEEIALLGTIDFMDDESSFTNYGYGYANTQKVQLTVQWMKFVQSLKKPWIVDEKWNTHTISRQQFDWALGTYLLGKYHYASVFIDHLPGYGYEYWYSQYSASIGAPCGDMYADLTHAGVFYRKYTGAYVVVNTSATSTYSVSLPKPSYKSLYGNTITSPMTIPADDGEVLLTTQNGCL
jgi:hypothetical protein